MRNLVPQLTSWRAAVNQLETDALEIWARPLAAIAAGFGLAAVILLAERILDEPLRRPVEIAAAAALVILAIAIRWRTRGAPAQAVASRIVDRVTRARELMRALPSDLRTSLSADITRLTDPISPLPVGTLTVLAVVVCALSALGAASLAAAFLPQLGHINLGLGLILPALLLPAYVNLVTETAAQRLEERAVLVERLSAIVQAED